VATALAVEGLDVESGRELTVVADEVGPLVAACAEALDRPVDRARLDAGLAYVRAHHDRDRVVGDLASVIGPRDGRGPET